MATATGPDLADVARLAEAAAHYMDTLTELAARWHRAESRKDTLPSEQWLFQDGMQSGWIQAIALLTGVTHAAVLRQLQAGEL